jgi:tRNA(Ser,Leu) C12 N-acetylase TAN1
MKDWNVVVTAHREGGRQALRALRRLGRAESSGHYNVFLAKAPDPFRLLGELEDRAGAEPALVDTISRIAPAQTCFDYSEQSDFERKTLEAVEPWLERLAGRTFHVRVHRRGSALTETQAEEARLGRMVLDELERRGARGRISFEDADLVLSIDAVGRRAGLGLWSRQDLKAHRFLRPD